MGQADAHLDLEYLHGDWNCNGSTENKGEEAWELQPLAVPQECTTMHTWHWEARLERWSIHYKHILILRKTQVQFPAYTSVCLQPAVTPALGDPVCFLAFMGTALTHTSPHSSYMLIYTQFNIKIKVFKRMLSTARSMAGNWNGTMRKSLYWPFLLVADSSSPSQRLSADSLGNRRLHLTWVAGKL